MKVGQVIKLGVLGFFFFLFVALDLVLFGVIPLNSVMVTVLPLVGLLVCALLGFVGARGKTPAPATAAPAGDPGGALPPPPMT